MCLAVPGKVLEISGDDPMFRTGRVSFEGVLKEVSLACVPEVAVGDYVLVHVGFALSVIDPDEARAALTALQELDGSAAGSPP